MQGYIFWVSKPAVLIYKHYFGQYIDQLFTGTVISKNVILIFIYELKCLEEYYVDIVICL